MPEKLTEAELNQKLSTIGLPGYGKYEQKLARLELHSKPVNVTKVEPTNPNWPKDAKSLEEIGMTVKAAMKKLLKTWLRL